MFAKVGVGTAEDPRFVSSAVPSGARRYQLMVMDKKKHPAQAGWGYALFSGNGKTFPDDPKEQIAACHACHEMVQDKGYVFSEIMNLKIGPEPGLAPPAAAPPGLPDARLNFATQKAESLPEKLRKALPLDAREVDLVQGALQEKMFQGTLDEIRPSLARRALQTGRPAALVNRDGMRFSMVAPLAKDEPCDFNGKKGRKMIAVFTFVTPERDHPVTRLGFCQTE